MKRIDLKRHVRIFLFMLNTYLELLALQELQASERRELKRPQLRYNYLKSNFLLNNILKIGMRRSQDNILNSHFPSEAEKVSEYGYDKSEINKAEIISKENNKETLSTNTSTW